LSKVSEKRHNLGASELREIFGQLSSREPFGVSDATKSTSVALLNIAVHNSQPNNMKNALIFIGSNQESQYSLDEIRELSGVE
jgi:hypothetical protein